MARPSKVQREIQRREERDSAELLYEAKKQEFTAALRKRLVENAIHDVTDVVGLAEQLAAGDPFLIQELSRLVTEYNRQVAQDIRTFGNGLSF
ncbi:hypothetical protein [Streptomyces sp. HM190]|uniref:hypothetical protein n=1 Tax=Streptomyces sp. HM190 TaxID=2695266 RepID=UPI001356E2EF|nr:hypothetical protein [Streptomyces sp. HM190]